MKKTILIAESGSTKTDWCLIDAGKKKKLKSQGINPVFQTTDEIQTILQNELKLNRKPIRIDEVHFYGAGIYNTEKKKQLENCLKQFLPAGRAFANSDLLASARATCGQEKGIACILGTGSNSGLYNGKSITFKTPALGYILGDEGGGTYIGRKVLQYFLHKIFDDQLMHAFSERFPDKQDTILETLYRKPLPNRYLASFAHFVLEQRGHYMIENIAEDCLNDFFINHLLRYPRVWKYKVHFTGSVAFGLKDILKNLCQQYDIECGTIVQKPISGLIRFHESM